MVLLKSQQKYLNILDGTDAVLRIKYILIAIDQLINTIFNGYPDETFSSRCYRWHRDGKRSYPMKIVDTLLFFDDNHCQESYESEVIRNQLPPEFRIEI